MTMKFVVSCAQARREQMPAQQDLESEEKGMAKVRIQIGLLLILLVLVIVGFVYAIYYTQEDETKEGTLVEYSMPEAEWQLREASL